MIQPRRRVFILADLYPPTWAPRMATLVEYLCTLGWEVTVFTEQVDEHLTSRDYIPPCTVHRIALRPENRMKHAASVLTQLVYGAKDRAFADAVRDLTAERPDVILASTYRLFPLGAASILANHWGVPWVADCRDIIEQYSPGDWLPRPLMWGGIRLRWLENLFAQRYISMRNKYLRTSRHIITVSRWHVECLHHLGVPCSLIYNGYDDRVFQPEYPEVSRFSIVFAGRILSLAMRDPSMLYRALSLRSLQGMEIEVHFYTDDYSADLLLKSFTEAGYDLERTYFHPMQPSSHVPKILSESGIILLVGNEEGVGLPQGMVSTKLFEALAMGKPTLLLPASSGEAAEILHQSGAGIASSDAEEISSFIAEAYEQWSTDRVTRSMEADISYIRQFTRERQARCFADILDSLVQ